jgi:hypothetical protein
VDCQADAAWGWGTNVAAATHLAEVAQQHEMASLDSGNLSPAQRLVLPSPIDALGDKTDPRTRERE